MVVLSRYKILDESWEMILILLFTTDDVRLQSWLIMSLFVGAIAESKCPTETRKAARGTRRLWRNCKYLNQVLLYDYLDTKRCRILFVGDCYFILSHLETCTRLYSEWQLADADFVWVCTRALFIAGFVESVGITWQNSMPAFFNFTSLCKKIRSSLLSSEFVQKKFVRTVASQWVCARARMYRITKPRQCAQW